MAGQTPTTSYPTYFNGGYPYAPVGIHPYAASNFVNSSGLRTQPSYIQPQGGLTRQWSYTPGAAYSVPAAATSTATTTTTTATTATTTAAAAPAPATTTTAATTVVPTPYLAASSSYRPYYPGSYFPQQGPIVISSTIAPSTTVATAAKPATTTTTTTAAAAPSTATTAAPAAKTDAQKGQEDDEDDIRREVSKRAAMWVAKNQWDFDELPHPDGFRFYMSSIMYCAGADGIDEKEKNWVLGYASALGAPEDLMKELSEFTIAQLKEINLGSDFEKFCQRTDKRSAAAKRGIIYDAIRAASADGVFAKEEKESVVRLAVEFKLGEAVVDELEALHAEEKALQKKKAFLVHRYSGQSAK